MRMGETKESHRSNGSSDWPKLHWLNWVQDLNRTVTLQMTVKTGARTESDVDMKLVLIAHILF